MGSRKLYLVRLLDRIPIRDCKDGFIIDIYTALTSSLFSNVSMYNIKCDSLGNQSIYFQHFFFAFISKYRSKNDS